MDVHHKIALFRWTCRVAITSWWNAARTAALFCSLSACISGAPCLVQAANTDPGLELKTEVFFNGRWIDFAATPELCATSSGDFRIVSTTRDPYFVSAFVIPHNGKVIPIFPWVDSECTRSIDAKKQKIAIIHGKDIDTALFTRGLLSEGELAIVLMYGKNHAPSLRLLPNEISSISRVQQVASPGLHVLKGISVSRSTTIEYNVEFWKGIEEHRRLVQCYQAVAKRMGTECEFITTVLLGTLEPGRKGFRDAELKHFEDLIHGSISSCQKRDLSTALTQAELALGLGKTLFHSGIYPEGNVQLATAFIQHGNVSFMTGNRKHALRDYLEAARLSESMAESSPSAAVMFSKLTCHVNSAACYVDEGNIDFANREINLGTRLAKELHESEIYRAGVLDCEGALILSKSTLLSEFQDRDDEAIECLRLVDKIADEMSRVNELRAQRFRLVFASQNGMICLKRNQFELAVSYFEQALEIAERMGSNLRPEDLPSNCIAALTWIHLIKKDFPAARSAAQKYLETIRRIDGGDPLISLHAAFSIYEANRSSAELLFGESFFTELENRIKGDFESADFRSTATVDIALSAAEFLLERRPEISLRLIDRVEAACRLAMQNRAATTDRAYLIRALLLRASITMSSAKQGEVRLLANEARRLSSALLERDEGRSITANILLDLGRIYDGLGRAEDASRMIAACFEIHPTWPLDAPGIDRSNVLMAHAYRRWCQSRQSNWTIDKLLYNMEDHAISLHIVGEELESKHWCRSQRISSAMLLEGLKRGFVTPEPCYEFCAIRKGLGPMAMRLRRSRGLGQDSDIQKTRLILEKRQFSASAIRCVFLGDSIAYEREGSEERVPIIWSLRPNETSRSEARRWAKTSTEIGNSLQPNEVLVDVFLMPNIHEYNGRFQEAGASYVAFLLACGQPTEVVQLGDAAEVQESVKRWRERLIKGDDSKEESRNLRESLWTPIERRLRAGQSRIYICPDSGLNGLPWTALQGTKPNSVLLDEYTIAVIPYGQYICDQRGSKHPAAVQAKRWLLIGDIDYDSALSDGDKESGPEPQPPRTKWSPVEFSKLELREIGAVLKNQKCAQLTGSAASTANVLDAMQQANWIHFATHSYFVNPEAIEPKDPRDLEWILRRPLLLSGVVLAGANRGQRMRANGQPEDDGGILSGEVIKDLPLDHVRMVVLSSCDSGVGLRNESDGAAGLQRAFHLAGARNVVATLWPVDDRTTAGLMKLYYYNCFEKQLDPIEALRQAQLAMRRSPAKVVELIELRGPDFNKAARKLDPNAPAATSDPAHLRSWAGFVFSGTGD